MNNTGLIPIQAVEQETGVSKELLRMWERRYDFPTPLRDEQGDRIYPAEQVNKLRLIKRLINSGFRPGKIISLSTLELEALLRSKYDNSLESASIIEVELLRALRSDNNNDVREYLSHQLTKMGLQAFVLEFLQFANPLVGDAWMRGELEIHEEHLYTEQVQSLIRTAITQLKPAQSLPKIMLTTPPNEHHSLGILMVEALLRLDHVDAVCFGTVMPIRDMVQGALKHQINIVALSFSASYPAAKAIEFLEELRFRLPLSIDIWAGGSALRSTRRHIEAVTFFNDLNSLRVGIQHWQANKRKNTK